MLGNWVVIILENKNIFSYRFAIFFCSGIIGHEVVLARCPVLVRSVLVRSVLVRSVLVRSVLVRSVLVRSVLVRSVLVRSVLVRSVLVRSVRY